MGRRPSPALLVLLLWKVKGLGEVPAFALDQAQLAAGSLPLAADFRFDRYFELDFEHWRLQMDQLREFFWSARLAQWAPVAGLVAVLRVRRWAIAALLAGWLGAFLVVKGFSTRADIQANTFWRLLMPAWPAYLLLFASIPLLVPTFARRLGDRVRPVSSPGVARRWIVVAALLTVVVPGVAIAVSTPLESPPTKVLVQDIESGDILTPIDGEGGAPRLARGDRTTADVDRWRPMARRRLLPRLPARRSRRGHGMHCRGRSCHLLRHPRSADRDDQGPLLRRRDCSRSCDVQDRRWNELDRRPGRGRRVRVQPSRQIDSLTRDDPAANS